jgi:glycosyltransferase involved in cell wall biosynthesis
MLPDAQPQIARSPDAARQIDLDDLESRTHYRVAALYRGAGNGDRAALTEAMGRWAEAKEATVLKDWDRVYVCSDLDRDALDGQGSGRVHVLPNAVRPPAVVPAPRPGRPFTFLFIGTFGYFPNEDGLRHFCETVLPVLRQEAAEPFRVVVAGFGAGPGIQALADEPDVEVAGAVADVAPWYADADAVIVPVRAGGGTRIKVLEAFAYGRPVVSTAVGCEGLRVRDGDQLLVAETDAEMAHGCLRLMRDAQLRRRLVEGATDLLRAHYTLDALSAQDPAGSRWGLAP